jgi:transcriptional antiterminator NusG
MEAQENVHSEETTEAGEPEQAAGESLDLLEHDQPEEAEIAADDEPLAGDPSKLHSRAPAPEPAVEHAEQPVEEPAAGGYDEASPKKWFIIHTYSGFENKVAESLKTRADAFGFADKIGQILIPTEEVVELRNGKKVTSKRLVYPGYVLVEMEMNDQLWHEVKNTPRVTGFVGGGNAPVPLSADEVNQILYRQQSSAERPRPKMTFEKNDSVRIVDGPFANFSGKVDEVNPERGTLRVMVTIFGRATPVELEFLQVEKA